MNLYPKRLIEVDLPIKRISEHARREKSIRHGHISTLHIWWARRPLAACRAVICAALWPDPADPLCPQSFRKKAAEIINDFAMQAVTGNKLASRCARDIWNKWLFLAKPENLIDATKESHLNVLRNALLDFIADFANWDNSTNEVYLAVSRALTQAAHESLGGEPGMRPLVVDPFAGGGAIPLEALRVGADAFASDLNPVAVLLNKVVLEYIPKYGQRLAEEVRKWGEWVKREAEKELAEFYPKDLDGATPIAYLWARTIICEGPGCGVEVPLIRSLWLSKKANRSTALRIIPDKKKKRVDFEIIEKKGRHWSRSDDPKSKIENPKFDGTVQRGSATCPVCGYTTPVVSVRRQLSARRGGAADARLFCVVTTRPNEQGRFYRKPTSVDLLAVNRAEAELAVRKINREFSISVIPDESTQHYESFVNRGPIYGMIIWSDYFTPRQALTLSTLVKYVCDVGHQIAQNPSYDSGIGIAIQSCLAAVIDRQANTLTSISRWHNVGEKIEGVFARQAIAMVWDFAEANSFSGATGNLDGAIEWVEKVCETNSKINIEGHVEMHSATNHSLPDDSAQAFITDPPYYFSVQYADLSDFFYVWLKRMLAKTHPDLFKDDLTPKDEEIIVQSPGHQSASTGKNTAHYESKMKIAMSEGRRVLAPSGVGVIVFAHTSTAGWESQLQAMIEAGWTITGSWPIDTEMASRVIAQGRSVLASSIHLVCRPRENADGSLMADHIGDYRDVLHELPQRIRDWMPRLAAEGVVGADAIFACLGPALEIFSRYSRVEKVSGEQVLLREYLEQVWAAVSKEALNMIFSGADATGFEADARLTAMWFWTLKTSSESSTAKTDTQSNDQEDADDDDEQSDKTKKVTGYTLEFDAARKIAQGLGAHLEDLESVIEIKGDKARLLSVSERSRFLFGKNEEGSLQSGRQSRKKKSQLEMFEGLTNDEGDYELGARFTLRSGATTLDRVHQSMLLFAAGRGEALKRLLVEDGIGRDQRFWRLADALSKLYPPNSDEKRWVDGVLARKKGLGF
jgi:putative DNA methylase